MVVVALVVEADVEEVEELGSEEEELTSEEELVLDAFVVVDEMGVVDGLVNEGVTVMEELVVDGLGVVVEGVDVVDGLVLVVEGVLIVDGFVEVKELVVDDLVVVVDNLVVVVDGLVVVVDLVVLVELGVGDIVDVGGHQVVVLVVRIVTILSEDEGAVLSSSAISRPCRAFNSLRGPNGWS